MRRNRLFVTALMLPFLFVLAGDTPAQVKPSQVPPVPVVKAACPTGWQLKSQTKESYTCVPTMPKINCPPGWVATSKSQDITVGKTVEKGGTLQVTYHVCEVGCTAPVPPPK